MNGEGNLLLNLEGWHLSNGRIKTLHSVNIFLSFFCNKYQFLPAYIKTIYPYYIATRKENVQNKVMSEWWIINSLLKLKLSDLLKNLHSPEIF